MSKFCLVILFGSIVTQEIAYDYEMENPIEIKAKGGTPSLIIINFDFFFLLLKFMDCKLKLLPTV